MIRVQDDKSFFWVIYMVSQSVTLDYHVVYIDFHVTSNLVFEDFVH